MTERATPKGTKRYANSFAGRAADGHFREVQELVLSSLGAGTYLGQPDERIDAAYTAAIVAAVENGINVLDAAINYRFQRSERSIGAALVQLQEKGFSRDQLVLCTKAGYLTPDGKMPADPNKYFFDEYIQRGIFSAKDIAAGSHCMAPRFLQDQILRSLANLGVNCIDVFYLHNPETQLGEISKTQFLGRIREAFFYLESAVRTGKIQFYGVATWNGFRQDARARDAMQLAEMVTIAKDIAGDQHHFRFIQLPFNLGMTEALTLGNQSVDGGQQFAGICSRGAGSGIGCRAGLAVRAIGAGNYHCPGGNVARSARAGKRPARQCASRDHRAILQAFCARAVVGLVWLEEFPRVRAGAAKTRHIS